MTNKVLDTMNKRIPKYSHCFNQSRKRCDESDSSLGFPKSGVSLYDDFEPSCLPRPSLNDAQPLPSLEQENDLPMSLSPDLAPCTSAPKGITDDVLVSADPPTTLNNFYEFDVGEHYDTICELDISITPEVEPRDLDKSQEAISQELCDEVTEPTILDFDDDIPVSYTHLTLPTKRIV